MSQMIDTSIIIPTFQEVHNIGELVRRISAAMSATTGAIEILIVDDNSQDGTDQVVERLRDEKHPVRLIVRERERGLSSAVIRGFNEAVGTTLVCMDADLSHPPEMLPELLAALDTQGVDFVIGSRYVKGAGTDADWGLFRRMNSSIATALARPLTRARDPLSGFFALRQSTFRAAAPLQPMGYKIGLELIVKCNCRNVCEVPIHFAQRRHGSSKLTMKQQWLYLRHVAKLTGYKFFARR
ncbi:MAG: polyprenol monophosphomannose synthase [Planctomycetes bacterium]|nr:polyprenol monophosphomannose synthase [Planctomycetota bacterium]